MSEVSMKKIAAKIDASGVDVGATVRFLDESLNDTKSLYESLIKTIEASPYPDVLFGDTLDYANSLLMEGD